MPAEQTLPATSRRPRAGQARSTAVAALTPGTTVGGRYRLVSLVSADTSGHWFWRAKDTVLPRDMAVTMLPDTSGASATVARTLRAGRLHHIGLPQTLDVGTDYGQSYVVGQWVDGATLTDLLVRRPAGARRRHLDHREAVRGGRRGASQRHRVRRDQPVAGAGELRRSGPALARHRARLGHPRPGHQGHRRTAVPDADRHLAARRPDRARVGAGRPVGSAESGRPVPAAPTRLGRELPADEVRPAVPEALSALAERALHPEEPDGIHAVGAIAALLRSPETVAGIAQAPPVPEAKPLSPADRRLIKERRVKLSLASVVLAVFAVLIVIAIGGLTNQFVASIQNSAPDELPMIDSALASTETSPTAAPADPATTAADAAVGDRRGRVSR